jgi:hypothetical protein
VLLVSHDCRSADVLQTAIASFAFCYAKKSLAASQGHAECPQKIFLQFFIGCGSAAVSWQRIF